MRPRLLVLTSTYPRWPEDPEPGFVHELSWRLAERYEVHVLCPHAPGADDEACLQGVFVHRYRYAPARWETLNQGGGILANLKHRRWKWGLVPFFLLGQMFATVRLLRSLQPTIVHAHWIVPQGLVLAVLRRFGVHVPPVLLTSHGGDLFSLRGGLFARLKTWALRDVAAVTVVSKAMVEPALRLGVDREAVRVIPMGVDFQRRFSASTAARRRHEILFVGRLVEKKGVRYLLDAMPEVLARVPDARLTIVGYGPELEALRQKTRRLGISGKVIFTGALPQHQLPEHYQTASLFVAPFVEAGSGDLEGFPVALMEAVACECPLLAGDLEVLRDAFGSLADSVLVDPRKTSLLAERIVAALSDPEEAKLGVGRLRESMSAYLDWDVVAEKYARVLAELEGAS